MEAEHKRQEDREANNPPITRVSVQEADGQRRFHSVGDKCVACNLPCEGNNIPSGYSHKEGVVNVFRAGIIVKGWDNPEEGRSAYFASRCNLAYGKICVTSDETLRKSVER
jgi:hypothetical protein